MSLTGRMRRVMRRARVVGAASPCHGWRHTSATVLHDLTKDAKVVQARMGHSTPAIMMALYVHPVAERDREAVEHFGDVISR